MPSGVAPRIFRSPLVLLALFVLLIPAITPRLNASDEVEYFAWLRSWTFDRDANFRNEYEHFYEAGPLRNAGFHETFLERTNENGRPNNFTPIGTALLWAPFYAAGHVWASLTGNSQDGYGPPYIRMVTFGSACYGLMALLLSSAIARRVLGDRSIGATLAVWIGTPLVFYMYVAPGFGHACSAFAVALLLWTWLRVRGSWTLAGALQLGAAGALLPMVREQDVFFLAGPAIDFVRWALRQTVPPPIGAAANVAPSTQAARSPVHVVLATAVCGVAACFFFYLPQLAAYQALNGHPGPPQVVSRKMSWSAPHFFGVLASPEHGFLIWTPLALIAIGGLVWLAVHGRTEAAVASHAPQAENNTADVQWIAMLALLMVILQLYVSGSVESWTVAGSFGQRRMVALTPVLVLGVAVLIQAWRARPVLRGALVVTLTLCVWWNLGLMAQFGLHTMNRQRLTLRDNARQTFLELPGSLPSLVWRYLFHRESFFGLPASAPDPGAGSPR